MSKGLNYRLSSDIKSISGGERQRIILARLLLRHPSFVVIDELTSGLDHGTAQAIEKNLFDLFNGMIYVTHRIVPEVTSHVDEVLIIGEGGQLLTSGTWEEVKDVAYAQGLVAD